MKNVFDEIDNDLNAISGIGTYTAQEKQIVDYILSTGLVSPKILDVLFKAGNSLEKIAQQFGIDLSQMPYIETRGDFKRTPSSIMLIRHGNGKVYYLGTDGKLHHVRNAEEFLAAGFDWDNVDIVYELPDYPIGEEGMAFVPVDTGKDEDRPDNGGPPPGGAAGSFATLSIDNGAELIHFTFSSAIVNTAIANIFSIETAAIVFACSLIFSLRKKLFYYAVR